MNSKYLSWRWSAGLIVLLLSSLFLFLKIPVIQFDFGHTTYYVKEDSFILKWIHSVEKEEWLEYYERDKNELILTDTYFKTFGAGVPSDAEFVEIVDGFVHMKINLTFPEIHLTVSENAQTAIEINEREIPLYRLTNDYETVTISIHTIPLWEYIGGETL